MTWYLTPGQQLEMAREKRDYALDCIEGTDAEEFKKWDALHNAWATIVDYLEEELRHGSNKVGG